MIKVVISNPEDRSTARIARIIGSDSFDDRL